MNELIALRFDGHEVLAKEAMWRAAGVPGKMAIMRMAADDGPLDVSGRPCPAELSARPFRPANLH